MKYFMLIGIVLLSGCQSSPKKPKQPDTFPRVPINKTLPTDIIVQEG